MRPSAFIGTLEVLAPIMLVAMLMEAGRHMLHGQVLSCLKAAAEAQAHLSAMDLILGGPERCVLAVAERVRHIAEPNSHWNLQGKIYLLTNQSEGTTGQKTVFQYLLKPLYAATATAFHER